jgi:hypothetical protein
MPGRFAGAIPNMETAWTLVKGRELTEFLTRLAAGNNGVQGTPSGGPSLIQAGVPGALGDSQAPAPSNHVHPISTATPLHPVALGGAPFEGGGLSLMRSDAQLVLAQGGAAPGQGLVYDPVLGWVPANRSILPWILS